MKTQPSKWRIAFLGFDFLMLNCSTIGSLLQPPTLTLTATGTPTSTPTTPAYPTAVDLIGTRWTVAYDMPEESISTPWRGQRKTSQVKRGSGPRTARVNSRRVGEGKRRPPAAKISGVLLH